MSRRGRVAAGGSAVLGAGVLALDPRADALADPMLPRGQGTLAGGDFAHDLVAEGLRVGLLAAVGVTLRAGGRSHRGGAGGKSGDGLSDRGLGFGDGGYSGQD